MKTAKWIAFSIAILSGAACLLSYLGELFGRLLAPEAASIGVIGSADGPTVIFTSRNFAPGLTARTISPVVFVLSVVSWLFFMFKSKKQQ